MKKIHLYSIIIIFFHSIIFPAISSGTSVWPTPGEISIVASTPIPQGVTSSRQSYLDLIECGFNLGMEAGTIEYFKREFELLKGLNFKYLIQNGDLNSSKRALFIDAFKDEPNFAGWKLWDEPHYDDLNTVAEKYKALYDAYPQKLIYVNQAGVVNKWFTGPYTNFLEFLDYFNNLIHPEIWSYDYYPIIRKDGKLICQSEPFYFAFETFSEQSKKTGKPFWAYCESMAYDGSSSSMPVATEAYLRFEAFSALAYGAQGIVYWTYGQRKPNASENYKSALVNLNGKKSTSWFAAQKVNREIKKFNDVFYGCKILMVRHTGDKIYKGTKKLSGAIGPLQMVRSKEAGVMISRLENHNTKYIIIINRDVFNKQKITLELLPNKNIVEISSAKNKEYSWRNDINVTLDKGGYIIFKEV